MILTDFITDYKRAVATEIYNAQMNSVEDAVSFLDKMEKEAAQFFDIISKCESLFEAKQSIEYKQERVKKLNDLKNSHIGQLIAKFAANNTDEGLEEIKKELELSNDFDIDIAADSATFRVNSTSTFYHFDNFDIDADIQRITQSISYGKNFIMDDMTAKIRLCNECGTEAFDFMAKQFKEHHMIMPNAPCNYREDYDDDYNDY